MTRKVQHRISRCDNCGWFHGITERVVVPEVQTDGTIYLIKKSLCDSCRAEVKKLSILKCDLCGETTGDNIYPVTIERKRMDGAHTCNTFLNLCSKCRLISHEEVLKRVKPPDLCTTCSDRFICYTSKESKVVPSRKSKYRGRHGFHKNTKIRGYP